MAMTKQELADYRKLAAYGSLKSMTEDGIGRAAAGLRNDVFRRDSATRAEALARLREIPSDTRDLTGRICGDPLKGRSALDKRLAKP